MPRSRQNPPAAQLTPARLQRLVQLTRHLGAKPSIRADILKHFKMDLRAFYRDLEALRRLGIVVLVENGVYRLQGDFAAAMDRLPFPDPQLTFREAMMLAKGKSAAHLKLKAKVEEVIGE
jgi:predicted DNA-binding transcriptional regulator YafY